MAIHMKMILLSLVMLLIAFEPAFSGKILKKLDKELKKMGLQKLQKFLADIGENAVEIGNNANEIDSNIARIDNNAMDIQNDIGVIQNEIDSNTAHINTNALDIKTLETNGSGSVWFDAVRTSSLFPSDWTTITYSYVRESNAGAMDVGTGVFTAPLAGTYQFILQVFKFSDVDGNDSGHVKIVLDGTTVSSIVDGDTPNDSSHYTTITGTAIVEMQPGQKAWAETFYNLNSGSNGYIHFTGVFITPK